jgi:hypothetical protein
VTAANRSRGIAPICLALCLVFSLVIYVELDLQAEESPEIAAGDGPSSAKPGVAPQESQQEAVTFATPPREAYNEVLERPPFSETRRPAPPAVAKASDQPLAATVIGTILSAGGVRALIVHGEPAELARVVEGQEIDGWKIKSILQEKVVLSRGGSTVEIKVKGNPAQANPPGAASPQPAKFGATRPPNSAPLTPSTKSAKESPANKSAGSRSAAPAEAAPASNSALAPMTVGASRSSGVRGTTLRGGGRRGGSDATSRGGRLRVEEADQ